MHILSDRVILNRKHSFSFFLCLRDKHWIRSANARLRVHTCVLKPTTQTVRYTVRNLSMQLLVKACLCGCPIRRKLFPLFQFFFLYFFSHFLFYFRYRDIRTICVLRGISLSMVSDPVSIIELLIFVCSSDRRFKSAPCYSAFFFEYIFRFQKDIVDVALVLFLAYNRMARIKRGSIRGKFYWPLSTAERATAENGMRHTMLP